MHFEHKAILNADRATVWRFMLDVPQVSTCVPGVQSVEDLGNDTYRGTLKVRVGPIALSLEGNIRIIEQDGATGIAIMKAEAADRKIGGAVDARMGMQVAEQGPTTTELTISTDANVLGRIGEFGQPVIRKKAEQMMGEFAENVKKRLGG